MRVVLFLKALLARRVDIMAADGHNIVTTIGAGGPYWLMLSHEVDCDGRCDATEGARIGAHVEAVPCSGIG